MKPVVASLSLAWIFLAACQTTGSERASGTAQPAAAEASTAATGQPAEAADGQAAGDGSEPDWLPLFTSGPLLCSTKGNPKMHRRVRATPSGGLEVTHGPDILRGSRKLTGPNTISRTFRDLTYVGTDTNTIRLNPWGKSLDWIGRYNKSTCVPED